jgi:ankyrin repeat protein
MAVSIRKGDCDRIRELITNGDASPLDIVGPYGLTALHLAIAYGQIEVYNLLTSMGAHNYPTTIAGRIGDITIFWSRFSRLKCSLPGVDVIEDLFHLCALDKYVNIIQANGPAILDQVEPLSRLHKTVLGLNYECSEQVIRLSRNCINEVDALKRTALHWAVCQGDLEKTEQLLRCGADPDISDRDAKTALHLASGLGYVAITDALISAGANLDARDSVLNTPLHIAAMQNRTSIIAHLVDAGAEFDSRSGLGETPLMCACLSDAYDSIILLFSLGADLEAKCNWGCSALGRGVKLNRHCTVKLLLELGAEVDTVRHDQRTILHLIAQATDKAMMNLLIDSGVYGFDANATDMDGLTALEHLELRDDADELFEIFSQFWQKENDRERTTQSETFFDALEIQIQG